MGDDARNPAAVQDAATLSGFRLGPFAVQERIATGGMGEVWRGVHVGQDVPVAIKVVRSGSGDNVSFRRAFRREARAVAQLDHPGIITLVDIGDVPAVSDGGLPGPFDAGSPYLVMEYCERGSLEPLTYPLRWSLAEQVLMGVLDGLSHAHARGITHRDLKPGNILLADERAVSPIRLTDFGIAFSYEERRATETAGKVVGTPAYMAPEQLMGEWRDFGPWTDLYALGCVAYQFAAGHVPFQQDNLTQLIMAHLEHEPPALVCPTDYPKGFATWVMTLLAKKPEDRYRRCADAAGELAALQSSAHRANAMAASVSFTDAVATTTTTPPQRAFKLIGAGLRLFGLRRVPMIDRDAERVQLWKTFADVSSRGTPGVIVLEGAAGTGKTRLAEWFCERVTERGLADCLKAEHARSRGRESGLSHMLAEAWSTLGMSAEDLEQRVTAILAPAGIDSRAVRKAVTELLAPASMGEDFRPGAFHTFGSRAARLTLLVEVLRKMYRERPLVLWLDDVHWGAETLLFVRQLQEQMPGERLPVMAILTARDDLLAEQPATAGLLREVSQHEHAERLHVAPLSDADSRSLVGNLLYLQGDVAERVSIRSGGNPLYATQLVGDWVDRGILKPGDSGFVLAVSEEPDIPDDVHAVWVRRLERVLDESTAVAGRSSTPLAERLGMHIALELAAALGGRIDMAEWVAACALAGVPDPNRVLEPLLASRMALFDVDGWSFTHSMLPDAIERIAREKRRWSEHNRICADMLEQRRPVPHWGDSERMGRYRFEAAQFEAAVSPLLRGAKERMRLEEYAAALGLLALSDRALDELGAPRGDPRRLDAWLVCADILCTRRELAEAEALARQVAAAAEGPDATRFRGAALLILARVHRHQRQRNIALDEFAEAERALRATGPRKALADCLTERAAAMVEAGQLEEAWSAYHEAQEMYEDLGHLVPWAENQLGLAQVARRQGDLDVSATLCRRVAAFARRGSLNRIEATALMTLSEIQLADGQLADAGTSLERAITLFEEMGLTRQALQPRALRALLWLEDGAHEKAAREFEALRVSLDADAPTALRCLVHAIGLAVSVHDAAADIQSFCDRITEGLDDAGPLGSDVVKCLRLAVERADEQGFPGRAAQITQLAETITAAGGA